MWPSVHLGHLHHAGKVVLGRPQNSKIKYVPTPREILATFGREWFFGAGSTSSSDGSVLHNPTDTVPSLLLVMTIQVLHGPNVAT
jgi:hypothetical protein